MRLTASVSPLHLLTFGAIFLQTAITAPVVIPQAQDTEAYSFNTQQHHHEAQDLLPEGGFRIPTRYDSTVLARRMLALSGTGVLSTIFPKSHLPSNVPDTVATTPIGLPDYIASCEEPSGNPTLLALTISTSTRNAVAGSNVSLALSWWDSYVELTGRQPWSAANLPRASLIGYLEEMSEEDVKEGDIASCFVDKHSDARWWLPGNKFSPHTGVWMRMVVQEVYWVGGFGDRAYIGWFEPEEWHSVTTKEWKAVRLPGEKA